MKQQMYLVRSCHPCWCSTPACGLCPPAASSPGRKLLARRRCQHQSPVWCASCSSIALSTPLTWAAAATLQAAVLMSGPAAHCCLLTAAVHSTAGPSASANLGWWASRPSRSTTTAPAFAGAWGSGPASASCNSVRPRSAGARTAGPAAARPVSPCEAPAPAASRCWQATAASTAGCEPASCCRRA